MEIDTIIEEVIKRDPKIISIIGAGLSKASGMPTFRGEDGLWKQYRAEELATPFAFARDPELVWDWYRFRMRKILKAEPNPAHHALRHLEESNLTLGLITQNVDGLHELAAVEKFVEIHGRIRYARCPICNHSERWDEEEKAQENSELPYCPKCVESILRPDVVWFGETIDPLRWDQALEWSTQANVLLIIGTSGVVQPVASLPWYAKQNNALLIEFNVEETPLTSICDFSVFGPCEETLPKFTEKLIKKLN